MTTTPTTDWRRWLNQQRERVVDDIKDLPLESDFHIAEAIIYVGDCIRELTAALPKLSTSVLAPDDGDDSVGNFLNGAVRELVQVRTLVPGHRWSAADSELFDELMDTVEDIRDLLSDA